MKKITRRSFLAAAGLTAAALALTACGGSSSSTASSTASSAAASSEAASSSAAAELTTVEAGKLTMATNAAFPPYEMTTDTGAFEGIDVDTAQAIAEKLGLELQIDDMDFDAALLSVQQGFSIQYVYVQVVTAFFSIAVQQFYQVINLLFICHDAFPPKKFIPNESTNFRGSFIFVHQFCWLTTSLIADCTIHAAVGIHPQALLRILFRNYKMTAAVFHQLFNHVNQCISLFRIGRIGLLFHRNRLLHQLSDKLV